MSKLCLSFICLFLFIGMPLQGQQNLDSLLTAYKHLPDNVEKVQIANAIFVATRKLRPEIALEYLHKGLLLSKKINSLDNEATAYKNLGLYHKKYYNPDSVPYYFEKAHNLFNKLNDRKQLFATLHEWTRFENLEGNFSKAIDLSDNSIALAKQMSNGELLSDAFMRRATIYLDKAEYKKAIEELLTSLRILDTLKQKNPIREAIATVGIGRAEILLENYESSLKPLQTGLKIFKDNNHDRWQAITYMELGSAFYHLKEYDQSLENYNKSLEISERNNWLDFVAANKGNIGAVYMEGRDYQKALEYFLEANKISAKRGSINNQIIGFNDIASAYYYLKEYPKALGYYTNAISLADSIGSIDNLADALKERGDTYEKLGLAANALHDFKRFQSLRDSIFNATKAKQIEELKTKYETEKKEQQIALQKNEIALLEQEARINNLQRMLLAGGLGLTLLFFGVGYYGIRQKMKRDKLEKEKVDAELAFKKKQLTTHALHLAKKNELLESLKQKAKELKEKETSKNGYQQLIRTINFNLQDDNNWENFSRYFEEVHKDFNSNVKKKYPEVTPNELRLLALLKMNLSSKEIANILNISQEGIKKARYRLRKKLDITTEDSLQDLVLSL
ncbi:tetratricopeptide repeat protein [Flagellimonas lutaonensis]|uniref:50S ribosomal protein L33 n=1 Tax=Flagellimonas lutaonensis TaxID=516051 RepID=A0A0D5YVP9_9FLAO|nr:hypothetical protein [Allomuricauda lutaonensis]AKA35981.1 50S ribosomal protein L33 [Allomuricauda lutaonensis]